MSQELIPPEKLNQYSILANKVLSELSKAILGQEKVLKLLWTALLAQGHVLLEGLPGLGKTQTVKSLASILSLQFQRIQFTPDLLPSDITGSSILEETSEGRKLVFHEGPIFANIVLADEINRASPKTQAALLEAMQERQTTVLGVTRRLPHPFFVLATQNPIELEGTYPLPEAQLDRFLFKIVLSHVAEDILEEIIVHRAGGEPPVLATVMSKEELEEILEAVPKIYLSPSVGNYISRLVFATHPDSAYAPEEVKEYVRFGASPRGGIAIAAAARAYALLDNRPTVSFDDVKEVAFYALFHRLVLNYNAKLDGWTHEKLTSLIIRNIHPLAKDLPQGLSYEK